MIKRCLLLLFLLALGVSPLLAQDALTQTAQQTEGGLTLTIAYPETWVAKTNSDNLALASSQAAVDALNTSGAVETPGDVGLILYMPSFLKNLQLPATASAEEVVKAYLKFGQVEVDVESRDDFQVPVAMALFDFPNKPGLKALLGALQFPDGVVIFGVVPGDSLDGTVLAVIQSITLTSGLTALPEISVDLTLSETPTTFDVPQRAGLPLQLAINLPEGWEYHYSEQGGLLYLGSSQAVVETISSANNALEPGEIGITIVMPAALAQVGIRAADTPEAILSNFETAFKATGAIETDTSLDVPAAYAHVAGENVPAGGGLAYALMFESGTIFAVVQPGNIAAESVAGLFRTIRLIDASAAEPTAIAAKELRQWASSADGTSQYGKESWSFAQATGAPDTPTCGDFGTAWAAEKSTGRAILRVTFEQAVIPTQINIYQSFNPGAIVEVDIGSSDDPNKVLPLPNSADPPGSTDCPGVFTLDVSGVNAPVNSVVIYIDQDITGNWNEIDAVELVGTPVE